MNVSKTLNIWHKPYESKISITHLNFCVVIWFLSINLKWHHFQDRASGSSIEALANKKRAVKLISIVIGSFAGAWLPLQANLYFCLGGQILNNFFPRSFCYARLWDFTPFLLSTFPSRYKEIFSSKAYWCYFSLQIWTEQIAHLSSCLLFRTLHGQLPIAYDREHQPHSCVVSRPWWPPPIGGYWTEK